MQQAISDDIIALAREIPGRAAIASPRMSLDFAGLVALSSRTARELSARGVQPGTNVAIVLRDSAEEFMLVCALWMLGAVPVPMDFRMRPPERREAVEQFKAAALIQDRPDAQFEGKLVTVAFSRDWAQQVAHHDPSPMSAPQPLAPALIAVTSGTTGRKMGIVLHHDVLRARVGMPAELAERDPDGTLLNPGPLAFTASLHASLGHLLHGGSVFFYPPLFDARELTQAIRKPGVTSVRAVPTMIRALLDLHAGAAEPVFPHLRYLYCASAPATPDEKKGAVRLLTPRFLEVYASTLTGRMTLLDSPDVMGQAHTVGRVLPGVEMQIVDAQGEPVAEGETGTLRVRSPAAAREVWMGEARVKGDRLRDGWGYTGDMGRILPGGFLQLMGRDSNVIMRGAENIYPGEIESAALACEGVRDAAAIGYPAPLVGEDIAVFYVADSAVTEQVLEAHLRTRLVPNKVPRTVMRLPALPRNDNGKVVAAKLRELLKG